MLRRRIFVVLFFVMCFGVGIFFAVTPGRASEVTLSQSAASQKDKYRIDSNIKGVFYIRGSGSAYYTNSSGTARINVLGLPLHSEDFTVIVERGQDGSWRIADTKLPGENWYGPLKKTNELQELITLRRVERDLTSEITAGVKPYPTILVRYVGLQTSEDHENLEYSAR